jgi:hypothetical protein
MTSENGSFNAFAPLNHFVMAAEGRRPAASLDLRGIVPDVLHLIS